jgi:hypothetical protein
VRVYTTHIGWNLECDVCDEVDGERGVVSRPRDVNVLHIVRQ